MSSAALREVSSNVDGAPRGKSATASLLPQATSSSSKVHHTVAGLAPAEVNTTAARANTANSGTVPLPPPQAHRPHTSHTSLQQVLSSQYVSSARVSVAPPSTSSSRLSSQMRPSSVPPAAMPEVMSTSPNPEVSRTDRCLRTIPYCPRLIDDITATLLQRERDAVRAFNEGTTANSTNGIELYRYYASPHYLQYQPDITPKMRVILIDWLIDVHKRFDHHRETLFLTVNIIDRYLSVVNTKYKPHYGVRRSKLQLVAVSAYLIATKYEQIIVPDLKEFVLVAAHSYTKKEVLVMESEICTALGFRFTVPTSYQFASRLLTVMEDSSLIRHSEHPQRNMEVLFHLTNFFLEHALLDYNALQFTPSQVGNAAVFLAISTLQLNLGLVGLSSSSVEVAPNPNVITWTNALKQVSTAVVQDFLGCAEGILNYVETIKNNKYQAVRQKYASGRCAEVSKLPLPVTLPHQ